MTISPTRGMLSVLFRIIFMTAAMADLEPRCNCMNVAVDSTQLSTVIGKIYDSAVDPALWPPAIEAMCGLIGATHGSVSVLDFRQQTIRLATQWGLDSHWMKLLSEKYAPL